MIKKNNKRTLYLILVSCGLFLIPMLTVLLLFWHGGTQASLFNKALIVGTIVTALYLPILLRLYLRSDTYTGIPLEEVELTEEDLKDAIADWVYIRRRKQLEGGIRLSEDKENNIKCRITIRTE
ncbi:MAG: hypothetical protein B0D92_07210 [Spirochaeta sp. LUC14_002_19_P3]|nr:MAG: hypothetical protein B0D92_07210 [Spirochaeta sp. LUC14_002_19_P3]